MSDIVSPIYIKYQILSSNKRHNAHCIENTIQAKNAVAACATIDASYDSSRFAEYLTIVKT